MFTKSSPFLQVEAMFAKMLDILLNGRHLKRFLVYLNDFIGHILTVAVSLANLRNIPIHQQAFMSNLFLAISRSLAESTSSLPASRVYIKQSYFTSKNDPNGKAELQRVGGNHSHLKKEFKDYLARVQVTRTDRISKYCSLIG